MLLNKFLFPAPKPPHYTLKSHKENLFWLPPTANNEKPIPCMFYSPHNSDEKIEYFIIFCHGNGCDIGTMQFTLNEFSKQLHVYIISFEYPSYGLCTAQSPSQQTINNHADRTMKFVRDTLQWPLERIIVYGHSIGSGAACYLASTQPIGALILQSPYTAINKLVREKVGIFAFIVNSQSWNNLEAMKNITCPVLFIHGLNDTLIPPNHSVVLFDACLNLEAKKLIQLRNEDHNSMTETTLLKYIRPFIEKQCKLIKTDLVLPVVKIDKELREIPDNQAKSHADNTRSSVMGSLFAISKASTDASTSCLQSVSQTNDESDENE